jgi:3-hydroxyisobutyrate dehydrogenase-like beta-hydroxyacid dehydrogenase
MESKKRIGWIGVGKMGSPMAKSLISAGRSLVVYDLVKERMVELGHLGANLADSLKNLLSNVETVISMIPDDQAFEDISIGPKGIFQEAKAGLVYVDMSTVSPLASSRVNHAAKEKGILYLRAPVSGTVAQAKSRTLTIFASGPREAYDSCQDIFTAIGEKLYYLGGAEEARYVKLVVNIMVAITSAMMAEALVFGGRAGMDWGQMLEIVNNSVVASPLINTKTEMLKNRDFAPAATVAEVAKVMDMALDTGKAFDIPMPITALVRQLYGYMKASGRSELDYFALVTMMEELAGIRR